MGCWEKKGSEGFALVGERILKPLGLLRYSAKSFFGLWPSINSGLYWPGQHGILFDAIVNIPEIVGGEIKMLFDLLRQQGGSN